MDYIKQWVTTISAVSIISGVLISLVPKSTHKTLYKSLTAIILVYAILQPFTSAKKSEINIDDYLAENYEVSNNIDEYALYSVIDSAEKAIENLFIEEAEKVNIHCNVTCSCEVKKNEIAVRKLIISPKQSKESIQSIYDIAQSLGIDTKVIVFEGE